MADDEHSPADDLLSRLARAPTMNLHHFNEVAQAHQTILQDDVLQLQSLLCYILSDFAF
jgi:hypothetical protein